MTKSNRSKKRPTRKKSSSVLVTTHKKSIKYNGKIALVLLLLTLTYIAIGTFVFFYLEDCDKSNTTINHSRKTAETPQKGSTDYNDSLIDIRVILQKICLSSSTPKGSIIVNNQTVTELEKVIERRVMLMVNSQVDGSSIPGESGDKRSSSNLDECEQQTNKQKLGKWFELAFATIHALGNGYNVHFSDFSCFLFVSDF